VIELLERLASGLPASIQEPWRARTDKLARFGALIQRWSKVTNLTRVSDEEGIAVRHLMDSAYGLGLVLDRMKPERVIDVGSGGGLPGVVWAILSDMELLCVDKVRKKTSFLTTAGNELGLDNLQVECADAFSLRGNWDLVTSRATLSGEGVAKLRDLGPQLALFLGPSSEEASLKRAMAPWSIDLVGYRLPGLEERYIGFAKDPAQD
jgi:16S rRNA (guanine(527)-N(7))-methyltransferase RsmG